MLSNDASNWRTVASFTGTARARQPFSIRQSTRFVRVRLRGSNYLSLAEVQVFTP